MTNNSDNHGVVYNIATSLPIVGTPARFLLDYTRLGVSQYGYLFGVIRGGLVGLVMFIMMLTLSEVIPLGWDIVHYYFQLRYVEPVKGQERMMLIQTRNRNDHPSIRHWHEVVEFELDWLNPGMYLLKEDPKPEDSTPTQEVR